MSTIKVDTITDTSGNSIPYMKGAVLQVKFFQLTTSQTTTYGTTATDLAVPNFTVSITPKSSSSIIKLEAHITYEWANNTWDTMWFFFRDSTKLTNTESSPGNRMTGITPGLLSYGDDGTQSDDGSTLEVGRLTYFDAPSTTSEIDYKLGVISSGTNNLFINRTVQDSDSVSRERGVSFISATEIGG